MLCAYGGLKEAKLQMEQKVAVFMPVLHFYGNSLSSLGLVPKKTGSEQMNDTEQGYGP